MGSVNTKKRKVRIYSVFILTGFFSLSVSLFLSLPDSHSSRIINLPATSSVYTALSRPTASDTPVICASQTAYIINAEEDSDASTLSFPAMRNPIRAVISSSTKSAKEGVFLTSDSERYINAFDPRSQGLVMNLIAERDVSSLSLYSGATRPVGGHVLPLEKQVLAAVTDDGTVELFTKPFSYSKDVLTSKGNSISLKERGKRMTRRADALVKIVRSEESESLVPVIAASFQGPELVIAWADGGIMPVFERVGWLNDEADGLSFTGVKKVVKSTSGSALGSVTVNGTKSAEESYVNESKAVVEQGNLVDDHVETQDDIGKDASSESDGSSSEVSDEEEPEAPDGVGPESTGRDREDAGSDIEMEDTLQVTEGVEAQDEDGAEEEEEEAGEPSFGDLLQARGDEEIDVEGELEKQDMRSSLGALPKPTSKTVQQIPTGVSFSTVLAQSLKTNDSDMLESCFQTVDLSIVRSTIQRLDSILAATLLQKLAERLSARPGRYGHLLVWVQWTCVAHGGALAGKPDLLRQMTTLFKVMDQRSTSLPSLLLLKGKLDMLGAQLALRQSLRRSAEGDSDEEGNVIYVEGEEEDSDANLSGRQNATEVQVTLPSKSIRGQAAGQDEVMVNGVTPDASDEEENEEEEEDYEGQNDGEVDEDENLLDTEAEESAGSSDAEESVEEDEDEESEDDSDGDDSEASLQDFIADSSEEEDSPNWAPVPEPMKSKKAKKLY